MKRIVALLLFVLTLCACALIGGCAEKQEGLRKITLNEVTRSVFYAPLYAAVSKGFFEEEGLELVVHGDGAEH